MDFTQSMDNGYMIPSSIAVGSGEATDIRCVCDTVEDFKTFLSSTGMELRYEGLVTYEKVNKLLKVYKGDDTWQTVGEGGGNVDTSNFITLTQLSQQLGNYYTKTQTDNKISEEIAKAQIGGSGEVDLSAYATKNYVDDEISKIVLGSGNIVFRDALVNEVFELEKASDNPNESVSVESISLNFNNYTLKAGETIQLIETVLPYNATNKSVVWNSSNLNATVVNGLVTANTEGVCTITCSTVDGNKSATCNIIINEATTEDTNANLLLWLDGKDVGEVSGIWKDKSGNGNDMTLFNTDNLIISDGMVQFSGTVGGGMESYGYSSIDLIDKSFTVLLEGVFPNSFKCGGTHSQTIYLNVMPKKMAIFRKGKSFEPDYANVFNGIDPHKIVISHNKDTKECLVFVDNVQVASGTLDSMCSSICRFGLGSNYGGGTYYKMGVSQLKIYDTVINV